MASSAVCMSKQALENTTMHVHRIREIQMVTALEIEVTFQFEKLILNKTYKTEVSPYKWDLQVVRRRRDTALTLSTRSILPTTPKNVVCCVTYDDAVRSDWIEAVKTSWDTYVIELPTNIISNHKNAFLTSGKGLVCVLEVSISIDTQVSPHAGTRIFQKAGQLPPLSFVDPRHPNRLKSEESDEGRLVDILVAKSAQWLFPDFELHTEDGMVVEAHRSVLAVRSRFFRNLIRNSEKLVSTRVNLREYELQMAIAFMYYSEILTTSNLVDALLELSQMLEIESLDRLCLKYIERCVSRVLESINRRK